VRIVIAVKGRTGDVVNEDATEPPCWFVQRLK